MIESATLRAIFIGGPYDGRIETAHRPPPDGVIAVPVNVADLSDDPDLAQVTYVPKRMVDTDGTTIIIYAPEDELVDGPRGRRPDVTLWRLAVDVVTYRRELDAARRELEVAEDRAALALRHADAMAGELRDLREDALARRARDTQDEPSATP